MSLRETLVIDPPRRAPTATDQIRPEPSQHFVLTPSVRELAERAQLYLEAGYPVHLAGPAGTGKTTLAFHIAAQLGQPVTLIHGDDEFGSSDLVGQDSGYRKSRLVDNFVRSVLKTEEEMHSIWVDNRLTTACRNGHVLIYDEFTRSRAEANNVLLSIFEEKLLNLPKLRHAGEGYLAVHPKFRAILTSNPEEYAGTHKTQDALLDRLVTIAVSHHPRDTEIAITERRSGIDGHDAEVIVDIVRELRALGLSEHQPTIRACIAIAKVLALRGHHATLDTPLFLEVCRDVLIGTHCGMQRNGGETPIAKELENLIHKVCAHRKTAVSIPSLTTPENTFPSDPTKGPR